MNLAKLRSAPLKQRFVGRYLYLIHIYYRCTWPFNHLKTFNTYWAGTGWVVTQLLICPRHDTIIADRRAPCAISRKKLINHWRPMGWNW